MKRFAAVEHVVVALAPRRRSASRALSDPEPGSVSA